jgi:hypothetical protein
MGVRVRVGTDVLVGGLEVRVGCGTKTAVAVLRALLVFRGVTVTKRLCVSVTRGVTDGGAPVPVGTRVSVGTNTVTTCSVSAAAVSKFETARSTILSGSSVIGI